MRRVSPSGRPLPCSLLSWNLLIPFSGHSVSGKRNSWLVGYVWTILSRFEMLKVVLSRSGLGWNRRHAPRLSAVRRSLSVLLLICWVVEFYCILVACQFHVHPGSCERVLARSGTLLCLLEDIVVPMPAVFCLVFFIICFLSSNIPIPMCYVWDV